MTNNEGWAWPLGAKKAHYFKGVFSLCRGWMCCGDLEQGNDDSPENCKTCRRLLAKKEKSA